MCFDARDVSNESAQKSASKRLHITCGLLPECWDVSSKAAATSKAHLRKEASEVGGRCRGGRRDAGHMLARSWCAAGAQLASGWLRLCTGVYAAACKGGTSPVLNADEL